MLGRVREGKGEEKLTRVNGVLEKKRLERERER